MTRGRGVRPPAVVSRGASKKNDPVEGLVVEHKRIKRKVEEDEDAHPDKVMDVTNVLCDVVRQLHQHVSHLGKSFGGLEDVVNEQRAKLQDHSSTAKKDIAELAMALSETVEHVKMLEASSLGSDAATRLLDVRRAYTRARFDLARGFTLVLPKFFTITGFLSELGWAMPVNLWHMFLFKLTEHYRRHFDVESKANGTYLFRPRRSVFHYLLEEERYSPNGPNFGSLPDTTIIEDFRSEAIHHCNEIGRFDTESINEFFDRIMKFFTPLIIWEYSVTKKEMERMGIEMESLKAGLAEQCSLVETLRRGGTVEEAASSVSQQHSQAAHTISAFGGPAQHLGSTHEDQQIGPAINSTLIQHLSVNAGVFEKEVTKLLKKQRSRAHQLNVLQQCLRVLGDKNLRNLAVSGSTRVYELIKAGALKVKLSPSDLEDAWAAVKKIGSRDVDLQEVLDPSEAFHATEKVEVFDVNEDEVSGASFNVEKAIDSFIEAELSDHKAPTYMDNVILLKWLDSVKPVQTNQEPETTGSKAKAA
ncbi:hypothetical protein ACEPAF_8834 [Sanghuangporus sanghuang]